MIVMVWLQFVLLLQQSVMSQSRVTNTGQNAAPLVVVLITKS